MNLLLRPYLFFDGKCEEAIEFYSRTLGAKVNMLMRFKDSPEPPPPGCMTPGSENKVMHAQISLGDTEVLLADGRCTNRPNFQGFSLALSVASDAEADTTFKALADGGHVEAPLAKTFFSSKFGMVVDRFGVMWMIMVRPTDNPGSKAK